MDFTLTEEQKQIKALIREFCKREIDPKEMRELVDRATAATTIEELRACQPWHLLEKLHEVGLRQLAVPTEYGGGGVTRGGCLTRAIGGEEFGYHCEPLARIVTKTWGICARMEQAGISDEQKAWFFKRFMDDPRLLIAGTSSEPSSASMGLYEGAPMNTFVYKDGNEWVINGDKMFSHAGGVAGLIILTAQTSKEGPPSQSKSQFWVEKDTPGMTMEVNRMIDGDMNGNVRTHYDNVRIPESYLIGELNKNSLMGGRQQSTCYFAGLLGDAESLYDQMVEYCKERIAGGRPIIQHTHIATMLGELAIEIEATKSLLYRACGEIDRQELAGERVDQFWSHAFFALAKKTALRVADVATEIYAGIGGSVDMPLERFIRHSYLMAHADGTIGMSILWASMLYNDHKLACQVPEIEAV